MGASDVVSIWDKINDWMAPRAGPIDALMRPLVQPLAEQFDFITGDSEEVRSVADRWRANADKVRAIGEFQDRTARTLGGQWSGEAAEAFAALVAQLSRDIDAIAASMDDTAEFLDDAAMEIELAEQAVEDIIRELIEWALLSLAVSAALSLVTLGASAAAGAAAAAARAAVAGSRIATVLTKVAQALNALTQALRAIKAAKLGSKLWFVKKAIKAILLKPIVSAATGLTGSPVGETLEDLETGLAGIAADEYDDRRAGDDGPRTPLRDRLGDVIDPLADHAPDVPGLDDATRGADDAVPSFPGGG